MSMEVTIAENHVLVVLSGNVSEEEADRIKEILKKNIADEGTIYHMDFSKVDELSRDGISVLTVMQKMALNKFSSFIIKGLSGEVKIRFELLQMGKMFEIH